MLKVLRRLGEFLFEKPTLISIANEELYAAQRDLLSLKTAREYTQGLIEYREKQINRLELYVKDLESTK
jgi:hypothetical protein